MAAQNVPALTLDGTAAVESARRPSSRGKGLRPLAAPPLSVIDPRAEPPGGFAAIIPPAPNVVTVSDKHVKLPPHSLFTGGLYASRPAAWVAPTVNSTFGPRRDPIHGRSRLHTGLDLKASAGDSIGAALAGDVAFAGWKRGYGHLVIVDHGTGVSTYYAHLQSSLVNVGDRVEAGQMIGLAGSTGRSTGPHLHYEVRVNGRPVDPRATLSYRSGEVLADGVAVRGPVVEGWGDDPDDGSLPELEITYSSEGMTQY